MYELTPDQLWQGLAGDVPSDPDAPGTKAVFALAKSLNVPMAAIQSIALQPGPEWLAPDARRAICAMCLQKDQLAGLQRFLRLAWHRTLATFCQVHRFPLTLPHGDPLAPRVVSGSIEDPQIAMFRALSPESRSLMDFLCDLEEAFPLCRQSQRSSIAAALMPSTTKGGLSSVDLLSVPITLDPWLRPQRFSPHNSAKDPWARMTEEADPAVRRAAIWVGCWTRNFHDLRFKPHVLTV